MGLKFRTICSLLALAAVLMAAGCASTPTPTPTTASTKVFYPGPPDPPRIQLLTTFEGERDFAGADSSLAKFLLGDENKSARQLRQPYGGAMFDGKLYVADSKAPGLAVFDLTKRTFTVITGTGSGRMQRPINVTIDADGTKFVTDTARNQILVFDRDDRFVRAFGDEKQFKPVDAVILEERLYVADIQHHEIQVLDRHSGKRLFKFGKPGKEQGELHHPTNLAVGPDGDLYVVETSNFRVQRFKPNGAHVRFYGELGDSPGQFARPKGIAVDHAGRLLVGDAAFENVQIFDPQGRLLMAFGKGDDKRVGLNLPAGVFIDYASVPMFQRYADPNFDVEYLVFVVSQFGPNKVDVFGFGRMRGVAYPDPAIPRPKG
jgi:DNA-binding beta-propeller fold protein YncE